MATKRGVHVFDIKFKPKGSSCLSSRLPAIMDMRAILEGPKTTGIPCRQTARKPRQRRKAAKLSLTEPWRLNPTPPPRGSDKAVDRLYQEALATAGVGTIKCREHP